MKSERCHRCVNFRVGSIEVVMAAEYDEQWPQVIMCGDKIQLDYTQALLSPANGLVWERKAAGVSATDKSKRAAK